jgi:hypothetical protein
MAETLARSLIRLLVTVAILGAVYLFLVKPVLETTENTINTAFEGTGISEQIDRALDAADAQDLEVNLDSQRQARRLLNCIQRAEQDVERIQRCNRRVAR